MTGAVDTGEIPFSTVYTKLCGHACSPFEDLYTHIVTRTESALAYAIIDAQASRLKGQATRTQRESLDS